MLNKGNKKYTFILFLTIFAFGFLISFLIFYQSSNDLPSIIYFSEQTTFIPLVDRNYFEIVAEEIRNSKHVIFIAMFEFRFYENENNKVRLLIEELVKARKRGVNVHVILDQSDWNPSIKKNNQKTYDYLSKNDIEVEFDSNKKTLHSKLLIIDNALIIGSTNLGFYALERNHESSLLIRNSELADYYLNYWKNIDRD